MAVDGSITINTKLETGDAEKDLVALHGSIKKAASAMESIGRSSQRAFESARLKVEDTEIAIASVKKRMDEIAAESMPDSLGKSFESAKLKIEETKLALDALEQKEREIQAQKIQEFSHMPFSKSQLNEAVEASLASDKEYQKLQGQIDRTILKLDQYTLRMEHAKEMAVSSAGAASPEYQKLERQLDSLNIKLEQYRNRMEEAKASGDSASSSLERLRESAARAGKEAVKTGASTQKAAKDMKKMKDATIPLSKSLLTVGKMFKLMVLRMAMRAFVQATRQGFRDLAQYSAEFNRSMSALSTATLQARNSLTTAFAPALQAITPMILNAVNALVSLFNMMGMLSARVFGNATTFTKAKKAQVDYAKSVAGTNKAVKEQLAAFDELNVLAKDQGADAGMPAPADMFEEVAIPDDVMTLGDTLRSAFEGLVSMLEPAKQALQELWGELKRFGSFAWEGLKDFYELFLKPVGTWVLGEGLPRLVSALADGLAKTDWGKINGSLQTLWNALAPFAINVGEGLLWFWENVLVPLGTWTMNEIVPRFLDLLAAGLDALNAIIDAVSPGILWLWDNLLHPIAEWTGGIFLEVVDLISEAFGRLAAWFQKNGELIQKVMRGIGELAMWVWNYLLKPALTFAWDFTKIVIDNVITLMGGLSESILRILGGIIDFIVGVFTGDWERAWQGVSEILKGIWNGMVSLVEGGVNLIIDAVNWLIKQLNRFQIKIPDSKIFGEWAGETWGFNISELSRFALPRLATGAVIPPNAEFLAILGDQKHGRNIEAPEGLIRQIMREEMEGMGGSQEITIRFEGTMSQFVRGLKPYIDQEGRRQGRALIQGV